jgi:hypothetical protein
VAADGAGSDRVEDLVVEAHARAARERRDDDPCGPDEITPDGGVLADVEARVGEEVVDGAHGRSVRRVVAGATMMPWSVR